MHRVPLRRGSRSGEVQSVVPAAAAAFHRREPKQRTLRKTELCVWFAASGSCRFGLGCDFAHSADELRTVPRPTNWRTKTCANFVANGICPYGQRCGFLHSNAGIASTCTINKPTAPPFLTLPPASPPVRCRPTQPVVMAVPKALGRRGFINLQSAGAMASVRAERSAPAVAASAFSFAVSKPSPPLPTLPGLSPLLPTHLYSSIPFAA
ncbi:hypothetical protein DFJ73DRAFT_856188 [Zopfochytrium polystomum]|nr:hypothetical protein DFJ73DRAFT_856188 [Zopfochytrium polystomum]